MADINIKPVQRNKYDVTMDLLELEGRLGNINCSADIERLYAKYYALATVCENSSYDTLKSFVSEDLKRKTVVN